MKMNNYVEKTELLLNLLGLNNCLQKNDVLNKIKMKY